MSVVFEVTIPVFGLAMLGYGAARCGWFSPQNAAGLAHFVHNFAVPVLLFRTFAQAEQIATGSSVDGTWRLLLGYYAPMALFYGGGILISRWLFKQDFAAQIISGFACSYGNAILLGLPIALLTFGEAGAIPFFILLAVHALSAFTVTTVALEYAVSPNANRRNTPRWAHTMQQVARNPIILGAVAGLTCNQLGITLAAPVDTLTGFMQNAVTPCALFSFGAILSGYRIAGRMQQTALIIALKCVAFPLLVWVSCRFILHLNPLWSVVAALLAAQPVGVNVFLFATRYHTAQAMATTAVFLSTVFSLLSMPVLLYLMELHGLR